MWGSLAESKRASDIEFEITSATNDSDFDKTSALMDLEFEWKKAKSEYQFYNNPIYKLANTLFNFAFSLINKIAGNADDQSANSFSIIMIIPGIFVIIVGCGIGLILILASNGRGILGFVAQTVAPVGKETIEYTAPAYGKAAKEISKGWTSGKIAATKKKTVKKKK